MQCLHALSSFQINEDFASLYKRINKLISNGYAVIYVTHVKDINIPKNQLDKQFRLIDDLEYHVQAGALKIKDFNEIYSLHKNGNPNALLKKWTSIIKAFGKKGNFKGIVIFDGESTAFTDDNSQRKLVDNEQAILAAASKLGSQVICFHPHRFFDKMYLANLISLVNAHQCTTIQDTRNMESRKMEPSIIFDALVDGIEDVLGMGSGKLVIQTMRMIYKIEEEAIMSNPSLFQEKLEKFLGNMSIEVLDSACKKIKENVLLDARC